MTELAQQLSFKFTWRSYQQKFLDYFQDHIEDDHLHVVAPPGSGKTILGLEMISRVNKTTLVLAPTLTIRNQWQSRLRTFFIKDSGFDRYSLDIKTPRLLTFSTYQSLHALDKSLIEEGKTLVDYFKEHGIRTIVLDEAHHLKSEWWKSLFTLKQIENLTIIALTATPPYDSTAQEVKKYFDLCGPIDDEIAVPDLVGNGDLCPHQDFVYFSRPAQSQMKYIVTYRERIMAFTNALLENADFQNMLLQHPMYANTAASLEAIYDQPSFFSSILIFLKAAGHPIDPKKLRFLGFKEKNIEFPDLSYEWLEILLQQLLVAQRSSLASYEGLLQPIQKELARIGVYAKKRVNFIGDDQLYRSLASSPSKLESIGAILIAEQKALREALRAVVLTDFIRKEFLDFSGTDTETLTKLGVVSIFQYLRTATDFKSAIGILTGSLVILHKSTISDFEKLIKGTQYSLTPLACDEEFLIVNSFGSAKNHIVATMTALFEAGAIKILIGTKSLLGEGWDAPAINSLILASYVGSFVSSNQMRGRAIRVDGRKNGKTGNIWHLACLDPTVADGGKDLEKLERRFEAFSGVSASGITYIENGLERLQLPIRYSADTNLQELNAQMLRLAAERDQLKERWFDAISKGSVLVREVKLPYTGNIPFEEAKKLRWGNASKYLLLEVALGIGLFFPEFLAKNIGTLLGQGVFRFIYLLLIAMVVGFAPKTYKALKLYFIFGNTHKKTKRIAKALLAALYAKELLHTPTTQVSIKTEQQSTGSFVCYLLGATNAESSLFVNLLAEILAPIENPRYLLVYRPWLFGQWGMRTYHVVPAIFGKRKQDAQLFHKHWRKHVNSSSLFYTRTVSGRKELLKARLSHIVYQFKEVPKKAITWK
ncbi:DEAD/DEAH box helicase family protein [Flavobacteriaceae bacterium TP-CH-4]|uniref:DEAD/DEAH box helicase family protein n=1 Tax=Pelagihabitans pacificus TaxID=2696054 RepID=A0A967E7K5_9FLAO|nr:DEAD/DEAH box helicase family protein [Pelagihabitans pacificus]NHF60349.1 DEAD/DEAH box helicase family protein [Pelagihabitans pacificus]